MTLLRPYALRAARYVNSAFVLHSCTHGFLPLLPHRTSPGNTTAHNQILAETYQPMPSYRLCTSDGVVQLTEGLAGRLMEMLETRVREESLDS